MCALSWSIAKIILRCTGSKTLKKYMRNKDVNSAHYFKQRWFQKGGCGVSKYGSLNIPRFSLFLNVNANIQRSTFKRKNYNLQESVNDLSIRTWSFWKVTLMYFTKCETEIKIEGNRNTNPPANIGAYNKKWRLLLWYYKTWLKISSQALYIPKFPELSRIFLNPKGNYGANKSRSTVRNPSQINPALILLPSVLNPLNTELNPICQ